MENKNESEINKREVFIGGLPLTTSLEEVKQYLLKFGPLISCRLAFYKNGTLKGFGFAEFTSEKDASNACGRRHKLRKKRFEIRILVNSNQNRVRHLEIKKRKIFVRKLGKNIDEEILRNYFSQFGKVEAVSVLRSFKTQQSRRVGHVIFSDKQAAINVLRHKGDHIIQGKIIECEQCLLAEEIQSQKFSDGSMRTSSNKAYSSPKKSFISYDDYRIQKQSVKLMQFNPENVDLDVITSPIFPGQNSNMNKNMNQGFHFPKHNPMEEKVFNFDQSSRSPPLRPHPYQRRNTTNSQTQFPNTHEAARSPHHPPVPGFNNQRYPGQQQMPPHPNQNHNQNPRWNPKLAPQPPRNDFYPNQNPDNFPRNNQFTNQPQPGYRQIDPRLFHPNQHLLSYHSTASTQNLEEEDPLKEVHNQLQREKELLKQNPSKIQMIDNLAKLKLDREKLDEKIADLERLIKETDSISNPDNLKDDLGGIKQEEDLPDADDEIFMSFGGIGNIRKSKKLKLNNQSFKIQDEHNFHQKHEESSNSLKLNLDTSQYRKIDSVFLGDDQLLDLNCFPAIEEEPEIHD